MVILGIDAHKRTHTVVAIDEAGRELGEKTTVSTTTEAHLELVRWADRFGTPRRWAVEDCRDLSRRLEAAPVPARGGGSPGGGRGTRPGAAEDDGPRPRRRADLRQVRPDRRLGRGQGGA